MCSSNTICVRLNWSGGCNAQTPHDPPDRHKLYPLVHSKPGSTAIPQCERQRADDLPPAQQGRSGAVSVIAMAERGSLFDPGPCMYMEKLAVGPAVNPHMVSLLYPIERNIKAVASALGKPVRCLAPPACDALL